MSRPFHVIFSGIALTKFSCLMAHVHRERGYRVSYVVMTRAGVETLRRADVAAGDIILIDERDVPPRVSRAEIEDLARLEVPGVPTIHNMILGDRVLSRLPYTDAIRYAVHLARGLRIAFRELRPSVVIFGHDAMHSAMASAVAHVEHIPSFAINFSVIPLGYVGLSPGVVPNEMVQLRPGDHAALRDRAARLLTEFEKGRLKAPAYISAHNAQMVARRLPVHLGVAAASFLSHAAGSFERFSDYPLKFKAREYVRKRSNLLRFPKRWFISTPPSEPFLFFGFHRQPESTIDVYAPFHANQFAVVERVARAVPPSHKLLVKLHLSDADNYSRAQLQWLRSLPGVLLVRPDVSSREFIDRASAVVTIVGTMGLEAALMGKPVVVFGGKDYTHFPSVVCAGRPEDLPDLIRRQTEAPPPSRDAIIAAYAHYLGRYVCATGPQTHTRLGDWTQIETSPEELAGFVELFESLEHYLSAASIDSRPGECVSSV